MEFQEITLKINKLHYDYSVKHDFSSPDTLILSSDIYPVFIRGLQIEYMNGSIVPVLYLNGEDRYLGMEIIRTHHKKNYIQLFKSIQ
jgi:hypothetical protein